ncbi:MAG: CRTAC1 family protein [Terriglobales bacterium]
MDVTARAGIHFEHDSGAYGAKYLPETLGSGVGFIDYNHSGCQSILLLNGRDWPGHPTKLHGATMKLYRNNCDGTFTDVTRRAGLAIPMYAMGVAVGDYNNDGWDDLYITTLHGGHLFRNNGNGTFSDVTRQAGIKNYPFSTSACWLDYNKSGHLSLFVAHYVRWSRATDIRCTLDGKHKSYCTPEAYHGTSVRLYRNNGNGTFTEVTKQAGLYDTTSKSLGVVPLFHDGWPSIFVANDTQPNKLYHNNQNGTFTDEAVSSGVAFSEDGVARGGMGAAASDYNGTGRFSLLVGNFSNQMLGLYQNEGHGLFVDVAPSSEVGQASLLSLSFGTFFFDYNLDGRPDIFVADGHIDPHIQAVQPQVHWAENPLLFRNIGNGRFQLATRQVGPQLARPVVARGAAHADFDLDGTPDILISTNNGPAYLYLNTGNGNTALRIQTVGVKSNRDGIGTLVKVQTPAGWQEQYVKSGGSYLSASELPLTFGLGRYKSAEQVILVWPSGTLDKLGAVTGGQFITVTEGKGITHAVPLHKPGWDWKTLGVPQA